MSYDWIKALKVGDYVVVRHNGFNKSTMLWKVTAITRQNGGTIIVGTIKFNMFGNERTKEYHRYYLEEYTPEILDEIERQRLVGEVNSLMERRDIPTESIRQILALLIPPGNDETGS